MNKMDEIKQFIDKLGIKYSFLADKIGIHKSAMSNYMSERFPMPEKHYIKLLKILKEYGYTEES